MNQNLKQVKSNEKSIIDNNLIKFNQSLNVSKLSCVRIRNSFFLIKENLFSLKFKKFNQQTFMKSFMQNENSSFKS